MPSPIEKIIITDTINDSSPILLRESEEVQTYQSLNISSSGFFTQNNGQITNPEVVFHTSNAYFLPGKVFFREYEENELDEGDDSVTEDRIFNVYSVDFIGSNQVKPIGENRIETVSNFFIGSSDKWASEVPNYNSICYYNLYDGIDLKYNVRAEGLKYEFILHQGANLDDIEITFTGADISTNGYDLFIQCGKQEIIDGGLYVYQIIDGDEVQVPANIEIEKNTINYNVDYNPSYVLIIDPIIFSTYLGGSADDSVFEIALDSQNNIYATGHTDSVNFPTTIGSYSSSYNGFHDIFISKLKHTGDSLISSTFFGGSNVEFSLSLDIDPHGNIIVIGQTDSSDFPTTKNFNNVSFSGSSYFYSKFDSTLSNLSISSFIFTSIFVYVADVEMDRNGNIFIVGDTNITDFPMTDDGFDTTHNGGKDAFLMKIDSNCSDILYSSYFGGSNNEYGRDIVLLNNDLVCIGGNTLSNDYPTTGNCYSSSLTGNLNDIFLTSLNVKSTNLSYSTYFGGSNSEWLSGISTDNLQNITIHGQTESSNLPVTTNAYDTTYNGGGSDIFIARLDLNSSLLEFSTYIGTSGHDFFGQILSSQGEVHLLGDTGERNWPVTEGAYDTSYNGGVSDVYYSVLSADGTQIIYSTFIGGSDYDAASEIHLNENGSIIIAGGTHSNNFPISIGGYQTNNNGRDDGFILSFTRFGPPGIPKSVTSKSGDGFVNISWEPPIKTGGDDEVYYGIYRGLTSDDIERIAIEKNQLSYNDTNVINGKEYFYKVSSINSYGESTFSSIATSIPGGKPSEPHNLIAVGRKNLVSLTWSPPNFTCGFPITNYRLLRCEWGAKLTHYRTLINITNFNDTMVEMGKTYAYSVIAVNERGESNLSNIDSTPVGEVPDPINKLDITKMNEVLKLKWKIPENNGFEIEMYRIFRGTTVDNLEEIDQVYTNEFYDIGLENGLEYFYTVSAINALGESKGNSIASGIPSGLPDAPSLICEAGDGRVLLKWSIPANSGGIDILEFIIYRGESENSIYILDSTSETKYNDTNLINGLRYFYAVSAVNNNGEGEISNIANAKPVTNPSYPIGLNLGIIDNDISLTWDPPMSDGGLNITSYRIYQGITEGDLSLIDEVIDNNFKYPITDWGEEIFFSVSAVNEIGESQLSGIVSITPITIPSEIIEISVEVGEDFIHLGWVEPDFDGGSEIVKYKIFRGENNSTIHWLGDSQSSEFNDTGLSDNTTFYYEIRAVNGKGEGPSSLIISATTLLKYILPDDNDDPPVESPKNNQTSDKIPVAIILIIAIIISVAIIIVFVSIVMLKRRKDRTPLKQINKINPNNFPQDVKSPGEGYYPNQIYTGPVPNPSYQNTYSNYENPDLNSFEQQYSNENAKNGTVK